MTIKKTYIIETMGIIAGAIVMSASLALFLVPHKIAPGGVSGLSTVLHHLLHVPVGVTMLAFNIPLFLLGIKFLGKMFGLRTLVGTILLSLITDFMIIYMKLPSVTESKALAALYGGVLMGVGLGLIFKSKGSTGGTDILAQVFSKYTNITTGIWIIIIDFFIISFSAAAFRDMDLALYAFIALYISSKLVDIILEGMNYAKMAYIISMDKSTEIAKAIMKQMHRGGTAIHTHGLYTDKERDMIMCVVTRKEVAELEDIVKKIDPNAFIIISEVHEVLGYGFRPRI